METGRSLRRGRSSSRSVQSVSEDSAPEVMQRTETATENWPDQDVQDLGDGHGSSQIADPSWPNLERGGDDPSGEEPQEGLEVERFVSAEEEQPDFEQKDTYGTDDQESENDGGIAIEDKETSSISPDDITGTVDKAELEKLFDPKWADLIKQLPEFCDPGLVLVENDHKEGNTKMMYQVPMMPIANCVKERWDEVNKELMESSQVSPFRKLDDKRYWISDTDFKKYCQSSTVDREYCIHVEKEVMKTESASYGGPPRRRPFVKKSSAIRNPLLQACENGFKKCDESARMAIRASSHAAFMINAVRNILEKSPSQQQEDLLRLIDGVQGSIESVADASARTVARATVSRRNICMSQIQQHETESFEDFITLPMDSKNLFHGEFYPTMWEHKKVQFSMMKRKVPPPAMDLEPNAKRPSLMDAPFAPKRPGFDYRDNYGGRYGSPPNRYRSWGGPYNEGYSSYNSGHRGGSHPRRGNSRW